LTEFGAAVTFSARVFELGALVRRQIATFNRFIEDQIECGVMVVLGTA